MPGKPGTPATNAIVIGIAKILFKFRHSNNGRTMAMAINEYLSCMKIN